MPGSETIQRISRMNRVHKDRFQCEWTTRRHRACCQQHDREHAGDERIQRIWSSGSHAGSQEFTPQITEITQIGYTGPLMERETLDFDVVFVGAGPANLSGALHL